MIEFTILDNHTVKLGKTVYVDARLVSILLHYGKIVALAQREMNIWSEDTVAPEIVELRTELTQYAGTDARSKSMC